MHVIGHVSFLVFLEGSLFLEASRFLEGTWEGRQCNLLTE